MSTCQEKLEIVSTIFCQYGLFFAQAGHFHRMLEILHGIWMAPVRTNPHCRVSPDLALLLRVLDSLDG
jgi:hypothetical protein